MVTTRDLNSCVSSVHADTALHHLEVEAELESADHRVGHEYLPMDIFVDARTVKQHFQIDSVCARISGYHPTKHH